MRESSGGQSARAKPIRRACGKRRFSLWPGEAAQRAITWSRVRDPALRFSAAWPLIPNAVMRLVNRPWDNVPASATMRACAVAASVRRGSTLTGDNPCATRYCEMSAAAVSASDVFVETWPDVNRRTGSRSAHCVRSIRATKEETNGKQRRIASPAFWERAAPASIGTQTNVDDGPSMDQSWLNMDD